MIIKQLAGGKDERKKAFHTTNDNRLPQIAIFQFGIQRETICLFVINSTVILTYLSWDSFAVESQKFNREQTVIEHCQSYFVLFCAGRELISLAELWFMVNLLLETYNNERWHCEYTFEWKRFTFDASEDKKLQAIFLAFCGFCKVAFNIAMKLCRVSISSNFSLSPAATSRSKSFNSCWAHLRFLRFAFVRLRINLVCAVDIEEFQKKIRYELKGEGGWMEVEVCGNFHSFFTFVQEDGHKRRLKL